jgi:hypothetical protein
MSAVRSPAVYTMHTRTDIGSSAHEGKVSCVYQQLKCPRVDFALTAAKYENLCGPHGLCRP